jgi:hypothetical protein
MLSHLHCVLKGLLIYGGGMSPGQGPTRDTAKVLPTKPGRKGYPRQHGPVGPLKSRAASAIVAKSPVKMTFIEYAIDYPTPTPRRPGLAATMLVTAVCSC